MGCSAKTSQPGVYALRMHELFEKQAKQTPDAIAVNCLQTALSYRALDLRSNDLARTLGEVLSTEDLDVAVAVPASAEFVIAMIAVWKAGRAVALLDPTATTLAWDRALSTYRGRVLLAESDRGHFSSGTFQHVIPVDRVRLGLCGKKAERGPDGGLAFFVHGTEPGLMVTVRSVASRVAWLQATFPISSTDVFLSRLNYTADCAVRQVLWPLTHGARVVIEAGASRDPEHVKQTIGREQITVAQLPVAVVSDLATDDHLSSDWPRLILTPGESIPNRVADRVRQTMGCELCCVYAPPEAATEVAFQFFGGHESGALTATSDTTELWVLDGLLQPMPPGAYSTVFVSGPELPLGYAGDPSRSAETFLPDPYSDVAGQRIARTLDSACCIGQSTIRLASENERSVWIGDRRVDLAAVERALSRHPQVRECLAGAMTRRQGGRRLVAWVVTESVEPEFDIGPLAGDPAFCDLPITTIPVDAFPLLTSGEIDREALRRVESVDSELLLRCERVVCESPAVESAVAISEPIRVQNPVVHLSDLIPAGEIRNVEMEEETRQRPAAARTCDARGRPASIADGGCLDIDERAPLTLTNALANTAEVRAEKGITIVERNGSTTRLTYAVLREEAMKFAAALRQLGFRGGGRAVLQISELSDYFTALWGCLLAGVAPVTVAPAHRYDERTALVNNLCNTLKLLHYPPIIGCDELVEPMQALEQFIPSRRLRVIGIREVAETAKNAELLTTAADPFSVAFFQLTSGSTDIPKCIQETHYGVLCHIRASSQCNGYSDRDVTLNWLPMDHVVPLLMFHMKDVVLGCNQVQVQPDAILANPLQWFDLIQRYRVTHTWAPNFAYRLVSDWLKQHPGKAWDLTSVRSFINAGEQVTPTVVGEFLDRTAAFGVRPSAMQPAYGMAELCTVVTYRDFDPIASIHHHRNYPGEVLARPDRTSVSFVDVGPPIPGVRIRIVDDVGVVVPEQTIGHLQVRGDVVTPGYFNNPQANQQSFTEDGWFKTGDLAFIHQASLTITGRDKDSIIINGTNYHCYEIEDLVNRVPGVDPTWAAACSVEDVGKGTECMAVFFCPRTEDRKEWLRMIKDIRSGIANNLGVNPAYVLPLARTEFPKTTSGKIQRSQLRNALKGGQFRELLRELDVLAENPNTLPNWFWQVRWRANKGRSAVMNGDRGAALLFGDGSSLSVQVEDALRRQRGTCVRVEPGDVFTRVNGRHYRIRPRHAADYRRLLGCLREDGIRGADAIHLWIGEQATAGHLSVLRRGECSLLLLVQALGSLEVQQRPERLYVVTVDSECTGAGDGSGWRQGGISGFLKTIGEEYPWLECRHIDIELLQPHVNARNILREMSRRDREPEVAYRNNVRLVPRLERAKLGRNQALRFSIEPDGMYVITGGLGRLGSRLAKYLLSNFHCRLLLTGRTVFPPANEWESALHGSTPVADRMRVFRELQRSGADVAYAGVDCRDSEKLQHHILAAKERWQCRLRGVFHLAGSYEEKLLTEMTPEDLVSSIPEKAAGLDALILALRDEPDSFVASFSSVNGCFGGVGVAAYAAANSLLDHYCIFRSQGSSAPRVYCIAWSIWADDELEGAPVASPLAATKGFLPISFSRGIHSLFTVLHHRPGYVLAGLDPDKAPVRRWIHPPSERMYVPRVYYSARHQAEQASVPQEFQIQDAFGTPVRCFLTRLDAMPVGPRGKIDRERLAALGAHRARGWGDRRSPRTPTERKIAQVWRDVLRCQQVGIDEDFFQLGGNSLTAIRILSRLNSVFQVCLDQRTLFEKGTVADLAGYIENLRGASLLGRDSSVRSGDREVGSI